MSLATITKDDVSAAKRKLYDAEKQDRDARNKLHKSIEDVEKAELMLELAREKKKEAEENRKVCQSEVKEESEAYMRRRAEFRAHLIAHGGEGVAAKYFHLQDEEGIFVHFRTDTPTYNPTSPNHSPGCSPFHTPVSSPGCSRSQTPAERCYSPSFKDD